MAKQQFSLIGLGPVGRSLAADLKLNGWQPELLIGRPRPTDRAFARTLKAPFSLSLSELSQRNGVIFLAVPTRSVKKVVEELAELPLPWKNLTVLHCAGPLGSAVLAPLSKKGAGVAAFHPYQTFPRNTAKTHRTLLAGTVWGISGNSKGVATAKAVAKSLRGIPVVVPETKRVPYHTSAVIACSQTIANLSMAIGVLKSIGVTEREATQAVLAIVKETIRNVEALGVRAAWSGPAVRGDLTFIKKQTKALYPIDPITSQAYGLISRWVMNLFGTTPPKRIRRKIKKGRK